MRKLTFTLLCIAIPFVASAARILVPMDESQKNHLKAYGVAYWVLEKDVPIEWMLNFRGGSFLLPGMTGIENELVIRGVSYQMISDADAARLEQQALITKCEYGYDASGETTKNSRILSKK